MADGRLTGSVSVPSNILLQQVPDQGIIFLDLTTEEYFGLNEVGTRMYEALVSSGSVWAAYQQLLGEYDVDSEKLRTDLSNFVTKLVERGLIVHEPD